MAGDGALLVPLPLEIRIAAPMGGSNTIRKSPSSPEQVCAQCGRQVTTRNEEYRHNNMFHQRSNVPVGGGVGSD